jgi:multidrug efflux system outer membrane protein
MKLLLSLLVPSFAVAASAAEADVAKPPAAFRDVDASALAWKTAEPAEHLARGEWWKLYRDPALDELATRALAANQDLRAAAARVEQARAAAGAARGAFWPQVSFNASAVRERTSRTTDNVFPAPLTTTYRAPLGASWEIDLFGRVRRSSENAAAEADASAATFEAVRLALTAEVAANYFGLCALDRELALLRDTVALRRRASDLIGARYRSGAAAEIDTVRAETELATAEAETAAVAQRRATVQNALAVLVGAAAPDFTFAAATEPLREPPVVPPGLPAELLERRPDVAAAERSLAAANARIGLARAAFFPAISLTGGAGFASGDIDLLANADSRIWSLGPSIYLPIFQGGRNRANLARSRAAYDEAVAAFRQRVLVAFREVQDALTATALLATQSSAQDRALAAARRATELAQIRYDAGFVSYLDVIDAQRTALAMERASVQLTAERFVTSVSLIRALGGGWHRPLPVAIAAQ